MPRARPCAGRGAPLERLQSERMNIERTPRVSVVLPTYNRLRTLPRAVSSVLGQDYGDLELIVVDDAGSDGSERWLAELAEREPRLRVLRHDRNQGVSAARNTGIAAARGAFVAFQDSDDEWLPGRMQALMTCFEQQGPEVGAVAGALVRSRGRNTVICRWSSPHDGAAQPVDFATIAASCFAHCQAMVFRRDLLMRLSGFDASIQSGEDWDLCLRAARQAAILELPDNVTQAYASADSLTRHRSRLTTAFERVLTRDGALLPPRLRARLHRVAALDACVAGDAATARSHLARALATSPHDPRLRILGALMKLSPFLVGTLVRGWRSLRWSFWK